MGRRLGPVTNKASKKKSASKRSLTKASRLKQARIQRRAALLAPPTPKRSKPLDPDTSVFEELNESLTRHVAEAPPSKKQLPRGKTNKGKRWLAASETQRLNEIMGSAAFQKDPLGAVTAHLRATLPPISK